MLKLSHMMIVMITTLMSFSGLWSVANAGNVLDELAPPDVRIRDIAYGDDVRQKLDLYLPPDVVDPPVLLMVHGGGYIFGDKFSVSFWARYYVAQGYAVVAPNYRLAPAHIYPAQIDDVMCALAWTTRHDALYGYNANRIVLAGESAGANAVTMLGVIDTPQAFLTDCAYTLPDEFTIAGVVALYPPVDLSTCECVQAKAMATAYLGLAEDWESALSQEDQLRDIWAEASALAWIDGTEPPFLLIHGLADELISHQESVLLADALRTAGDDVILHLIEGAEHGFISSLQEAGASDSLAYMNAFLRDIFGEVALSRP